MSNIIPNAQDNAVDNEIEDDNNEMVRIKIIMAATITLIITRLMKKRYGSWRPPAAPPAEGSGCGRDRVPFVGRSQHGALPARAPLRPMPLTGTA